MGIQISIFNLAPLLKSVDKGRGDNKKPPKRNNNKKDTITRFKKGTYIDKKTWGLVRIIFCEQ